MTLFRSSAGRLAKEKKTRRMRRDCKLDGHTKNRPSSAKIVSCLIGNVVKMPPMIPYPVKELDEFTLSENQGSLYDTPSTSKTHQTWETRIKDTRTRLKDDHDRRMLVLSDTAKKVISPFIKPNTTAEQISKDSFIRVFPRDKPKQIAIEDDMTVIDTGDKIISRKVPNKRRRDKRITAPKPPLQSNNHRHPDPPGPPAPKKFPGNLQVGSSVVGKGSNLTHGRTFSDTDIPIVGPVFRAMDSIIDNSMPQISPFKKLIKVIILVIIIFQVNVIAGRLVEYIKAMTGLN